MHTTSNRDQEGRKLHIIAASCVTHQILLLVCVTFAPFTHHILTKHRSSCVVVHILTHLYIQISQVQLPYKLESLEPNIDSKTMNFHYGTHYKAYVDNLNKATASAGASVKSSDLSSELFCVFVCLQLCWVTS